MENDVDDELLRALGSVIVADGYLTDVLSKLITDLIGQDAIVGEIVTTSMSFQDLLNVASSLFDYRAEGKPELGEATAVLKAALGAARSASQARNTQIHASWLPDLLASPEPSLVRLKAKIRTGALKRDTEFEPLEAVKHVSADLTRTAETIRDFQRRPEIRRLLGKA